MVYAVAADRLAVLPAGDAQCGGRTLRNRADWATLFRRRHADPGAVACAVDAVLSVLRGTLRPRSTAAAGLADRDLLLPARLRGAQPDLVRRRRSGRRGRDARQLLCDLPARRFCCHRAGVSRALGLSALAIALAFGGRRRRRSGAPCPMAVG